MNIQEQPNRWSCVVTAFAMATDIDQFDLIKNIGHDGSEKIFPDLSEPYCYKGFDPREIIYTLLRKDIYVVQLDSIIERVSISGDIVTIDMRLKLIETIIGNKGVMTGITSNNKYHAVAWDGEMIYDPNGTIYPYHHTFDIHSFFLIK